MLTISQALRARPIPDPADVFASTYVMLRQDTTALVRANPFEITPYQKRLDEHYDRKEWGSVSRADGQRDTLKEADGC